MLLALTCETKMGVGMLGVLEHVRSAKCAKSAWTPGGLMSEQFNRDKNNTFKQRVYKKSVGSQRENDRTHIALFYGPSCRPCCSSPRSGSHTVHVKHVTHVYSL